MSWVFEVPHSGQDSDFPDWQNCVQEKNCLHRPKAPLFPRLAVGVTLLMAHKLKSVFAGEVRHLRHQHRIRPSPSQTSQTGVVDNADLGCVAPEPESLVEETLHLEAVEAAIEAQEA